MKNKIVVEEEPKITFKEETRKAVVSINGKKVKVWRYIKYRSYGGNECELGFNEEQRDLLTEEENDELFDFVHNDLKW